ncbi:MAG: Gram-negative bacterial TonB protein C-terminal [Fibrobacterota bacterium]|jgi:protein TonB
MSRAIVSTRSMRRQIPASGSWKPRLWKWDPVAKPARKSRTAVASMLFAAIAVLAVVGLRFEDRDKPDRSTMDEIVWLEESPPPSQVPERTESVAPELPQPNSPAVSADTPLPYAPKSSVSEPSREPVFGMDDAVGTGGLEVAIGGTLARTSDPIVGESGPPAGPLVLGAVPGSTKPVVPRYPPRAEAMGIEASVVALVTTDTSGDVVGVRIEQSGGRDFDESVRAAVLSTRFQVPVRDGRACAVAFRLPYSFRLE